MRAWVFKIENQAILFQFQMNYLKRLLPEQNEYDHLTTNNSCRKITVGFDSLKAELLKLLGQLFLRVL